MPPVYIAGSAQQLAGTADPLLHPDFANNRTMFLSYAHGTDEANRTRLARAVLDIRGHALRDLQVIFEAAPEKESATGCGTSGRGPDGHLYLLTDRFQRGRILRLEPA